MRKLALNLPSMAVAAGLACAVVFPLSALAGPGGDSGKESYGGSIAELEIIKRQERVRQALELEAEGDELFARKDYEGAITKYQQALALLPMGSINQADRERIISKYARAAVLHADELGKRGEFEKAKALLNNVLSENMDPDYRPARVLLEQLDDPDRYNPAMSPRHYGNTEEVRRLFRLGIGYFDLGDFRQAEDQFNRILAIDPTNTAARRQMEKTEREISNYLLAARDHTRIKMLNEVDNLWVTSVPGLAKIPELTGGPEVGDPSTAPVTYKLNNIIIDRLQFSDASIDEVVAYLIKKSQESDNTVADPNSKGVNFILQGTEGARPINLDMRNVKLLDAVKSICNTAGMRYDIQSNAVVILPASAGGQAGSMTTRSFVVPPDFLTRGAAGGGAAGADAAAPADPFAGGADAATGPKLVTRPTAQKVLEDNGIIFPPGSSAAFSSGRLTVRNTYEMLDAIEALVETMKNSASKQVYITTKFVEVTQRNTDELGFDWLVGAFNVGSDGVFASGGTSGNAGPINAADFPVISPGGTPTGSNPITRGLRFGSDAVSRNAIDSLISGASVEGISSVSPGIFALAGVFTDPQFQVVMRALSQKKGVDLMTAPSVIVRSGQRSKVEVIREFPWPTEFDPPQIPQTFGGGGTLFGGANTQGNSFPVTPTTPNSFQFKNTGVTMEVEATVAEDNYSIDLNLAPEVVEFEGFVNYGSPIQTTGTNALGQPQPVVLTENKILQPVFATRKLTTQVLIWDRQTVGIGGLIREDVQAVEDKVPFLSSVPLVGRFFKTKTEEHFKKNLMIYVTGVLMDPSGTPIHSFDVPGSSAPPPPEPSIFPTPAPPVEVSK